MEGLTKVEGVQLTPNPLKRPEAEKMQRLPA